MGKGNLPDYLEVYKTTSKDFSSNILTRIDRVAMWLELRSMDSNMNNIIYDSLKTLHHMIKGLEWNPRIEKEWIASKRKLRSRYPQTASGRVIDSKKREVQERIFHLDLQYLIKMAVDIGAIERHSTSEDNETNT